MTWTGTARSVAAAALLVCFGIPTASGTAYASGDRFGYARLRYEGSLAYTRGDYLFDRAVTSWTLTSGLAYQRGRWSARLSVPAHLQSSVLATTGGGTIPGAGPLQSDVGGGGRRGAATPASPAGRTHALADSVAEERTLVLGDPVLHVGVEPVSWPRGSVFVSAAVKAPVASEADYGTGAWDAGGGVGVLWAPAGRWTIGAEATGWALGDLDSLPLRDTVTGTVALSRAVGSDWLGTVTMSAGTTPLAGYDGPATVGISLSRLRPGGASVTGSLSVGLSETVPDLSASLSWGAPLAGR